MQESLVWEQGDYHSNARGFAFEGSRADTRPSGFSILQTQSRKRHASWRKKARKTKGKAEEELTENSEH